MARGRRYALTCASVVSAVACASPYGETGESDAGVEVTPRDAATAESDAGVARGLTESGMDSGAADGGDASRGPDDAGQAPYLGSCKEIKASKPSTPSGTATITVGGTNVPAYCDMSTDGGGWTLVFRLSAGIPGDPYRLYTGGALYDDLPAEATQMPTTRHYVSRILGRWNAGFVINEARVRMLNGSGAVLAEIVFNAKDTGPESWFTAARVTKSRWTDLSGAYHFSIAGGPNLGRRFYINKEWTVCDEDEGWLTVQGPNTAFCSYEIASNNVRIMYAKGSLAKRWSTGVDEARSFAILVR